MKNPRPQEKKKIKDKIIFFRLKKNLKELEIYYLEIT